MSAKPLSVGTPQVNVQQLHILHVVRRGFAGGGMENGIINVANRLPGDKYRVSICALDGSETFSQRMLCPDSEFHLLDKMGEGIDWALVMRLARLLRRSRIGLVHSHNWGTFLYAVLAAKLARVPIIHGEHGKNAGEILGEGTAKKWSKRLLGPRIAAVTAVSQILANEWENYGVPRERVFWIPNGVDTRRFHPRDDQTACRRLFGLPEGVPVVGSVGRLDELKNIEALLDAMLHMSESRRDVHVALLGAGPREEALRERVREYRMTGRVHFLGHRPNPEDFLTALDVFVLPSRFEGMSNVVLEAMSSGLPVVCADLPAHREVFEPGTEGVIVSPCTPERLGDAIVELLSNCAIGRSIGEAARKKVLERFTIERMVADYERLYARYRVN